MTSYGARTSVRYIPHPRSVQSIAFTDRNDHPTLIGGYQKPPAASILTLRGHRLAAGHNNTLTALCHRGEI